MKKSLILTLIIIIINSCTKTDIRVLNLLNDIKDQNNELKINIIALQKTTDSLIQVINKNSQANSSLEKKIDSIQLQLSNILTQINGLNVQMTSANVNIADIQAKLIELQTKCSELYKLLNEYISLPKQNILSFNKIYSGDCYSLVTSSKAGSYFLVIKTGVAKTNDTGTIWSLTNWSLGIIRNATSTRPGAAWSSFLGGQLIVGGYDNGYFMSNDNGATFIGSGPTGYGTGCESIIALPDGRLIASMAGFPRGIYKSSGTNNNVWTLKWDGNPNNDPNDFTYYKNKIIYGVHTKGGCCSPDGGLLKSVDDGESWKKISTSSVGLYDCEIVGDSLAWADNNGNVFVSEANNPNVNVSARFNLITNSKSSTTILTDVDMKYSASNSILVATSSSGISVSYDRGISWKTYTLSGVSNYYNITIADGSIFICTNLGLYKAIIN